MNDTIYATAGVLMNFIQGRLRILRIQLSYRDPFVRRSRPALRKVVHAIPERSNAVELARNVMSSHPNSR